MDIESLRVFVDVARRGSFAAVGRERNLDPSSVSRTIALLEKDLGARLFQRSTRRVTLTEAGRLYVGHATAIVDELDRAAEEVRSTTKRPAGTLRMTASVAFGVKCIVPLLPEFRGRYPEVRLDLLLDDTKLDLVSEQVDLAIRHAPRIDTDLVGTKLFDARYRVCVSPAYLKGRTTPRVPDDLLDHKCLLFALPGFRSRWRFRDVRGDIQDVSVKGDVTILNALALRECALAGMGPALLANWLIDQDIAEGRLVDLFPEHGVTATDFDTAVWLLFSSRSYLPGKVRVMVDFLKSHLR